MLAIKTDQVGPQGPAVLKSATKFSKSYETYAWFAVGTFFSSGVTALLALAWGLRSLANRVDQIKEQRPNASALEIGKKVFSESLSGVEKYALWMFAKMAGFGMVSDALSLAGSLAAAERVRDARDSIQGAYEAVTQRFGSVASFAADGVPALLKLPTTTTTGFFESVKGFDTSEERDLEPQRPALVQTPPNVSSSSNRSKLGDEDWI